MILVVGMTTLSVPVVGAASYCMGYHEWWDGTLCRKCTSDPCSIGMYRESCVESSTRNARCIACSNPPSNARHTTGGMPYMQDNCMWACNEGYYNSDGSCTVCTTEACPVQLMMRETCMMGFTRDAGCMCPIDFYLSTANNSTMCVGCETHGCIPDYETFIRCPGYTTKDVSECVPTMEPPLQ